MGSGRRWEIAIYAALVLTALAMRLWDLDARAMHHDESLHVFYAWNIYAGNGYDHTPLMHGPLQMEGTAAVFFLFGDSDFTARLLYALAGAVLVVLPYLLRQRLGRVGAVFVAGLLAFSPAMLYFSRFARNDILMAVWTLGLVICVWRYLDEGKNRYLYVGAALLALAFASKETAYIVTATLGLYLALVVVSRNWSALRPAIALGEISPPAALWRFASGLSFNAARRFSLSGTSRAADYFLVLFTLTLPLGSALVSLLQDTPLISWSGLVLASPVGGPVPVGAPVRGGLVIAAVVVLALIWISASIGFKWKPSVWWRCTAIFFGIWVLLYTTFFTNIVGVGSGMWQSLGYWLVQQGEARGGQPWYYYFVITPLYEFLPLLLALAAGVYYTTRRRPLAWLVILWVISTFVLYYVVAEPATWLLIVVMAPLAVLTATSRTHRFEHFLVFWAVTTMVVYTLASEKMPWLLVNVALPLIVLAGKFLGDVVESIDRRALVSKMGLLTLGIVPVALVLLWQLAFFSLDGWGFPDIALLVGLVAFLIGLVLLGALIAGRVGYRNFASFALVPVVAILLVLSVRAALHASYRNGDTPVEMIVYTQTSPDIVRLMRHVESAGVAAGDVTGIPITVDGTSGFHWPWWWYLRDYKRVGYVSYDGISPESAPDASVVLVHERNRSKADPVLADAYSDGKRIKHRWWFPESYRGLTLEKLFKGAVDRKAWRTAMDYFLYRKLGTPLGSEDAFVYFGNEFPEFSPSL